MAQSLHKGGKILFSLKFYVQVTLLQAQGQNKDTLQTCKNSKIDLPGTEAYRGCALSDAGINVEGKDTATQEKRGGVPSPHHTPRPKKQPRSVLGFCRREVTAAVEQLRATGLGMAPGENAPEDV